MPNTNPPPTFAEVVTQDAQGRMMFNPIWLKWFVDLSTDPRFKNVAVADVGGYYTSDGSQGITADVTTASLVGKTLTFKDGICTGFA